MLLRNKPLFVAGSVLQDEVHIRLLNVRQTQLNCLKKCRAAACPKQQLHCITLFVMACTLLVWACSRISLALHMQSSVAHATNCTDLTESTCWAGKHGKSNAANMHTTRNNARERFNNCTNNSHSPNVLSASSIMATQVQFSTLCTVCWYLIDRCHICQETT